MTEVSNIWAGFQQQPMQQTKLDGENVKWFYFTLEEKHDKPILKVESINLESNEISAIARINRLFQERKVGFITESDSVLHVETSLLRSLQNKGVTQIILSNNNSGEKSSIQLDKVKVIKSENYDLLRNYFSNLYQEKLKEEDNEKSLNSLKKNISSSPSSTPTNFVKTVKKNSDENAGTEKSRGVKRHSENKNEKETHKLNRSSDSESTSDVAKAREKKLYQEKKEKVARILKSVQRWEEMQRIAQQSVKTFRDNHPRSQ